MKLAAHPLVVAVALGLLDASALTGLDERDDVTESHCPCGEMTAEECSPAVDACVEARPQSLHHIQTLHASIR